VNVRERLVQSAALVIRQDAKLLGIPSVRDRLIQEAVMIAGGSIDMPTRASMKRRAPDGAPENVDAMMGALRRAVEAVRRERIAVLKDAA
jgi:predicted DNA-binding helix-hairpin-helix protein